MTPLRARYGRIEKRIDHLLAEHEVLGPFVPVEKMVKAAGIVVRYADLQDVSGMLLRDGSSVVVGVNNKQAKTRQRFTISHEFGHFLLHEGKPVHYDRQFRLNLRSEVSEKATDIEEIEANFFAASLLMPRTFLERDVSDRFIELDDADAVEGLAKRYKVSVQAMNIRLLNLFGEVG
jgi:Zn-dependent peptidase ImmA (M78 family)